MIPLRGVEFVDSYAGFERLAIGSFSGGQAAGCAAVTAKHGVAAVIAVPAELPKRPRKKAGTVRHAVSDPLLTIFLCLFTARGVLLCLRPDFARRTVDVRLFKTACCAGLAPHGRQNQHVRRSGLFRKLHRLHVDHEQNLAVCRPHPEECAQGNLGASDGWTDAFDGMIGIPLSIQNIEKQRGWCSVAFHSRLFVPLLALYLLSNFFIRRITTVFRKCIT